MNDDGITSVSFDELNRMEGRNGELKKHLHPFQLLASLRLTIDKLLNALVGYDDAAIDEVRVKLIALRSQIHAQKASISWEAYENFSQEFSDATSGDLRIQYRLGEIDEVEFIDLVLARMCYLEEQQRTRPLTDEEALELVGLSEKLEESRRRLAAYPERIRGGEGKRGHA